jgi:hypothetical protein
MTKIGNIKKINAKNSTQLLSVQMMLWHFLTAVSQWSASAGESYGATN